jgi:tRNA A-37 threonylcarbamoyl transferase component Bud32
MLRKLEKYEVLEEIGHGGMATVYRARDTVLDRLVALKVMHPHLRAAEEARRRFHREARSVARLKHPRVLEIYDFSGEGSEEAYIAAELLTGPTLKHWREKQKDVPAEIAACLAIEIAYALDHAHAAGIVHRDVKPENVLLHENKGLKLTDFGIADMVDSQSMTATGQILGSPGHMAPEQIEGKDSDPRTDLFSLGTVLYYLATGRLPFTGRNPHQVLKRIVDGEYADPLRVNPTIGGRLRAIIVKSLEKDLDVRYQNARELIEDLKSFVAESGITDIEAMVERYLNDPEKTAEEVRKQSVDRLIDLGARASDAGDVPKALDYYNRVLALDEGNERVLKLIERVGIDRRRKIILVAGAGLAAAGLLMGIAAYALWPGPEDDRPVRPTATAPEDAGREPAIDASAAQADAGAQVVAAAADAGRVRSEDAGTRVAVRRERRVIFQPEPQNVTISIDGAPPRAYGSDITAVELDVGRRYAIRVVPGDRIRQQFEDRVFTVEIPSGAGDHILPLRLPLAKARLFVRTSTGVQVDVGRGRVRGRTNDILDIPMDRPDESLRVVVSADGYESYDRVHPFRSGAETLELVVELTPSGATPPP